MSSSEKDFLYEKLKDEFGRREIAKTEIPKSISENLNPKFEIRDYQKEAFQRFILFYKEPFEGRQKPPFHINFNMATGSGKTFVMAGLILYLFEKGFRNFLFFVPSTNIIEKTKDNFLNTLSSKFLFTEKIRANGKEIKIKELQNFEDADKENINIIFTTIQKLHSDLISQKENSPTFEDFKEHKVCLIADEAHHINTKTKSKQEDLFKESWENTVLKILEQNIENILLEFTATLDLEHSEVYKKYQDKIIFKYDLKQFRLEGFSKEINLLRSRLEQKDRILQALVLSQYKQEVAAKYGQNLKPVILFKAKSKISESEENKQNFHNLIANLTANEIEKIANSSTVPIVKKAFEFFQTNGISYEILKDRLQSNFDETKCLSANNDKEKEQNQIILNSLEDGNNPVRAIFAVHKLNEGWDVLNLFDIVRLYGGRDSKGKKIGKTTLSEAQLIGRGARYFPFRISEEQNLFTRKFDSDLQNELRVLEELHYHTEEDSKYIFELKTALVETGIYEDDEDLETKELELKDSFKETDFYKKGVIFLNRKVPKSYNNVKKIEDLGVKRKNIEFVLHSGTGKTENIFEEKVAQNVSIKSKEVELKEIQNHVKRRTLADNPFFRFDSLHKFFPNINSISEFISKDEYLNGLEITFKGTENRLQNLTNEDYFFGITKLLQEIEKEIKNNLTEFEGTKRFEYKSIKSVFQNKTLRINKKDERLDGQENFVKDKDWYVFNANYGTSEEKAFVEMFEKRFENLKQDFEKIYLVRNERVVKIYNFADGQAFEPDFALFVKQKKGEQLIYQVFIEPKGSHLIGKDKWKQDFLDELRNDKKTINFLSDKFRITGVPFFNQENENEFKKTLEEVIKE